jgi:hypothetical protein
MDRVHEISCDEYVVNYLCDGMSVSFNIRNSYVNERG